MTHVAKKPPLNDATHRVVSGRRCKTHAVGAVGPKVGLGLGSGPGAAAVWRAMCSSLNQGIPLVTHRLLRGLLAGALALAAGGAGAACAGPPLAFRALAPGLWLLPAQPGDADAANRGVVSNLVLAREGRRWWLLGSGPSPAHGRAVACQVRARFGHAITDVVSPWARPELVLGQQGIPGARRWAHADVANAMREQCPGCVDRLRERLGEAAVDLGVDPIVVPDQLLSGDAGRLGPFQWWRLSRSAGRWVTVWRHGPSATWVAHGLLSAGPPGDGRDADLAMLRKDLQQLMALAQPDGARAQWVGEQGAVQSADAPATMLRYWTTLLDTVGAAIDAGVDETAPAAALSGWPEALARHPWHALNWQRAWRQVEARRFDEAAPSK